MTASAARIGLPAGIRACLFDLDGVLTPTAAVHAAAFKRAFDPFLRERAARLGERFVPFDDHRDYDDYVDGRPRYAGVASFLAARDIELPQGSSSDPADAPTVTGLGNRENEIALAMMRDDGIQPYAGSVRFVEAAKEAGLRRAVVSSSTNCREVLAAAGIEELFEKRIDGIVAARLGLSGKPAPDTYLAGARALDMAPGRVAVFEDAQAGVAAGRAGGFGFVVGVDRVGQAEALRACGADVVVTDLADLLEAA